MKKILSVILSILLIVSALPLYSFTAIATENNLDFFGGSGTIDDPYLISNKIHLNNVRNDLNAHYRLVASIEFAPSDFLINGVFYNDGKGFEPIGTEEEPFSGNFDGNNSTISGIVINTNTSGLFGYNSGNIANIGIINSSIKGKYACGIAVINTGTIKNCYFDGEIICSGTFSEAGGISVENKGQILSCYNEGSITGSSSGWQAQTSAGGIVAVNDFDGIIQNCFNVGKISSFATSSHEQFTVYSRTYSGGIVASARGSYIYSCFNNGEILADSYSYCWYGTAEATSKAGGIAGAGSLIKDCYNTGNVESYSKIQSTNSHSSNNGSAGGIAASASHIETCYNIGEISSDKKSEISPYSDEIFDCYHMNNVTMDALKLRETFKNFDFKQIWEIDNYNEFHFPQLKFNRQEPIEKIEVINISDKNEFIESLPSNLPSSAVNIIYSDGKNIETSITDQMLPNIDLATVGTYSSPICYGGYNSNEQITVNVIAKNIEKIEMAQKPQKLKYVVGQSLDLSGGLLKIIYNNQTNEIIDLSAASLIYDDTACGSVYVKVNYKENTCGFYISVAEKIIKHISFTEPTQTSFDEGDLLNLSGGFLNITYESEDSYFEKAPLNFDMITNLSQVNEYVVGNKTVNIEYNGYSFNYLVVFRETATDIEISKSPDKVEFYEGEPFDSTGLTISAIYEDESVHSVLDYTLSGYSSTIGKKTITVTRGSYSKTFEINVVPKNTVDKPLPPTLKEKTDKSVTLTSTSNYEYSKDGVNWQDTPLFLNLNPNTTYEFYQRIKETNSNYTSEMSEPLTVMTMKSSVTAPNAPTLASKNDTTVTLNAHTGFEYSKDGVNWQLSNVFTELSPRTTYSFYQRVAETNTTYASMASKTLSVTTFCAINGSCGENLVYEFDSATKTLTILGTGEMTNYSSFSVVPWHDYYDDIEIINLPDELINIGDYAFWGSNIASIQIPNTVTVIGKYAFQYCSFLSQIDIPSNVTSIGNYAFEGCNQLKIVNNYSMLWIRKANSGYGYVAKYADTVNWYGETSGSCGNSLTWTFKTASGELSINGTGLMDTYNNGAGAPWHEYCHLIKSVVLPMGLTNIDTSAFDYCSNLFSIKIPDSVTKIESGAFEYCTSLTSITVGKNIKVIDSVAFNGCTNLKTIYNYSELPIELGLDTQGCIGLYADNVINISKPAISTITDTTIILSPINDFEYSKDGTIWQDSNTFDGLLPNTPYHFYQRCKSADNQELYSLSLIVITNKKTINRPAAPTLLSKTDSAVTLILNQGYEYSKDGVNWQDNSFVGLTPGTQYTFYQRIAETDTTYASDISEALIISTDKKTVEAPEMPSLTNKTDTEFTLVATDGYEYKIDDGEWQTSNVFLGLSPNTTYIVYCRIAETDITCASDISRPLEVTTCKTTVSAPQVPEFSEKTNNSITLVATNGYEYKIDNGEWQTSNMFTNLAPNSTHNFYQRVAESNTVYASESSAALIVTTNKSTVAKPSAPTYSGKTDTTITLIAKSGYEYKLGSGAWQSSNVFSGLSPATQYSFYQRVAETNTSYASDTSNALSVTTDKSTPAKPSAPTCSSKTDRSVTLASKSGYEYKLGNGTWQSNNVFNGLSPNKTYSFYQRVAATNTSYASDSSNALTVTTNKSTVARPSAPTLSNKTDTTVTLVAKSGYEYSKDGVNWQSSNVFNGLQSATQYNFYQRFKETDTTYASEVSLVLVVTTNSSVPTSTTSTKFTVSGSQISKITAGTTVNTLLSGLSAGQYCKVYKGNSQVSETSKVCTGMIVKIMDGNTVKASYTVIVTGDTNGDGDITITDMLAIKAHILKKSTLSGAYATAADTSGDNAVTITDFIQVKAKILGKGSITAR